MGVAPQLGRVPTRRRARGAAARCWSADFQPAEASRGRAARGGAEPARPPRSAEPPTGTKDEQRETAGLLPPRCRLRSAPGWVAAAAGGWWHGRSSETRCHRQPKRQRRPRCRPRRWPSPRHSRARCRSDHRDRPRLSRLRGGSRSGRSQTRRRMSVASAGCLRRAASLRARGAPPQLPGGSARQTRCRRPRRLPTPGARAPAPRFEGGQSRRSCRPAARGRCSGPRPHPSCRRCSTPVRRAPGRTRSVAPPLAAPLEPAAPEPRQRRWRLGGATPNGQKRSRARKRGRRAPPRVCGGGGARVRAACGPKTGA
mmetsp:Transcript_2431/g.9567  ORF Transcript_2431/g.9567 Transcript_2431/m.9567 type:complete len:313 (+) Transcript_2431:2573-3511(+)